MTKKTNLLHDGEEVWAIVDEDDKIIQRFRNKCGATTSLTYYQKSHIFKLKVVWVG